MDEEYLRLLSIFMPSHVSAFATRNPRRRVLANVLQPKLMQHRIRALDALGGRHARGDGLTGIAVDAAGKRAGTYFPPLVPLQAQ